MSTAVTCSAPPAAQLSANAPVWVKQSRTRRPFASFAAADGACIDFAAVYINCCLAAVAVFAACAAAAPNCDYMIVEHEVYACAPIESVAIGRKNLEKVL